MQLKILVAGIAVSAFTAGAAQACQFEKTMSMAEADLKKAPLEQSQAKENIELAAMPVDAWLIEYLA